MLPGFLKLPKIGLVVCLTMSGQAYTTPVWAADQPAATTTKQPDVPIRLLTDVLKEIKQRFGVDVLYGDQLVQGLTVPVGTHDQPADLEGTLKLALKNTGLQFRKVKSGAYLITGQRADKKLTSSLFDHNSVGPAAGSAASERSLVASTAPMAVNRQSAEQTITGKVTGETSEGLPGVNVVLKGSTRGTSTDVDGLFKLNVPDGAFNTLVFSLIGYTTQEIVIGNQTTVDIKLVPGNQNLNEVVVIGYGAQKKVSLTNAVSVVDGAELIKRPVSNLQQSLQGQSTGLLVLDRGGSPGRTDNTMLIRGTTSLNGSNDPLVIVDGIEQQMTNINPADIENVSVLKDAASTAIYGSRAANGVLLITTKRAKAGKLTVDYNGFYALQRSNNNPKTDLAAYMKQQQWAFNNAKIPLTGFAVRYTDQGISDYLSGHATNPELYPDVSSWYDVLLHSAPQMNHNLSIAGGGENFRARMSVRYQDQESILNIPSIDYGSKLGDIRINTDYNVSKRITVSTDLNYRNNYVLAPVGEIMVGSNPLVLANGGNPYNFLLDNLFAAPKYSDALEGTYPGITGKYGLSTQGISPFMFLEKNGTSKTWNENIMGNLKGEFVIIEGLKFTTQIAVRVDNVRQKNFVNSRSFTDPVKGVTNNVPVNNLTEVRNTATEYTWNNLVTYDKTFGKHYVRGLLGYSTVNNVQNTLAAYRQQFYNNDIQSISQGAGDGTKNNSGADAQFGLRSFFGRFNYSYADKYLLEVNGRYDGSSKFTGDNVYGFFPSFSAAWRISEEEFLKSQSVVNELKLRVSYGKSGNQAVSPYSYYQSLASSTYQFNEAAVNAISLSALAIPDITWETTKQFDIGVDAQLFKRISITFDYYKKRTSGVLLNLPIPAIIGLTAPVQNAGDLENQGVELQLGFRSSSKLIRHNTTFNISGNRNKVINLAGVSPIITNPALNGQPSYVTAEGYPINSQWGFKTAGLFQSQEEVNNSPTIDKNRGPGDIKFLDLNGDGQITASGDRTYIGKTYPDFNYGWNTSVGYKGFDLSLFFQGAAGSKVRLEAAFVENGNLNSFVSKNVLDDYWTPDNTDAKFSRPLKNDQTNTYASDFLLIRGDYLRLKNIQLMYTLPTSLVKKLSVNKVSIYLSATNLFTISGLNKWRLDAETSGIGGITFGRALRYPQVSVTTLGVNLQF